jgi:hypothetical protein
MGSPVFPVLGYLVMEYIENNVHTQHARLQAPILLPLCRLHHNGSPKSPKFNQF